MRHDQTAFAVADGNRPAVRSGHLIALLVGLLGLDNLLTLNFLGLASGWVMAPGLALLAALVVAVARAPGGSGIPLGRLAACLLVGLGVLLLGGEGHLLYANYDWIVRDAVLQDMMRLPWPFAYAGHGEPMLLRAPIGMYLLPAIAGKVAGHGALDAALLLQNGLVLGTLLALGSLLFDDARARRIALLVVIGFSGMDTIGQWIADAAQLHPFTSHIEGWAVFATYCANLTSILWAPQHALAGWIGAVLFLLWRTGRAPLAAFLAAIPLGLVWSPLATASILPFAAWAGWESLRAHRIGAADVLLPAVAVALAAVPILYLHAGSGAVGAHLLTPSPALYILFVSLEAGAWLAAAWLIQRGGRFGRPTFAITAAMLLGCALFQIGMGADFAMRMTLAPLAILSVLAADLLSGGAPRKAMPLLLLVFAVGALTPLREVSRAVLHRPTPALRCDFWASWDASFPAFTKATYVTPWRAMPAFMQAAPRYAAPPLGDSRGRCWGGPWQAARFGGAA